MIYSIEWHPQAYRTLYKLPRQVKQRILDKLDQITSDPFRYLDHYEGNNTYKLRIGDYRLLVDVDLRDRVLLIQVFDKRGRVYKR